MTSMPASTDATDPETEPSGERIDAPRAVVTSPAPSGTAPELWAQLSAMPLVDHHTHGVVTHDLGRAEFEGFISESDVAAADGTTTFDSQLGFAVRRWCAPVLDLPAFAEADDYLARRAELGAAEVNARLLQASGIGAYLLDTGHRAGEIYGPDEMADVGRASAHEIVRLESIVEELVRGGIDAASLRTTMSHELSRRLRTAVGVKSIAAYRIGLDFDPARPSAEEVDEAAGAWIARCRWKQSVRLDDPVLIRAGLWNAVDHATAVQFHVGFGDPDVDLARVNPLCLTDFLRRTRGSGIRVMLLHCYPFHREAGYLAHVFEHVYSDVGLAVNYVGSQAPGIIAESLELTPFAKSLFSGDAFGVPELHYLGAHLFRRGLAETLTAWAARDDWPVAEQVRVARMVGRENAVRAYRLP